MKLLRPLQYLNVQLAFFFSCRRTPLSTFERFSQRATPQEDESLRDGAPTDNLDIAQACFELPWRMEP